MAATFSSFNHHNGQVVEPILPHCAPKLCVEPAQGTEEPLTHTAADWNRQRNLKHSSESGKHVCVQHLEDTGSVRDGLGFYLPSDECFGH